MRYEIGVFTLLEDYGGDSWGICFCDKADGVLLASNRDWSWKKTYTASGVRVTVVGVTVTAAGVMVLQESC